MKKLSYLIKQRIVMSSTLLFELRRTGWHSLTLLTLVTTALNAFPPLEIMTIIPLETKTSENASRVCVMPPVDNIIPPVDAGVPTTYTIDDMRATARAVYSASSSAVPIPPL